MKRTLLTLSVSGLLTLSVSGLISCNIIEPDNDPVTYGESYIPNLLSTDKAAYQPGEKVTLSLNSMPEGSVTVRYTHLGNLQSMLCLEQFLFVFCHDNPPLVSEMTNAGTAFPGFSIKSRGKWYLRVLFLVFAIKNGRE